MTVSLDGLEQALGVTFTNRALLKEALTHRSYLNEHPGWSPAHNERLEFLGDAVLELIVSEELFRRYPEFPEGQLTAVRAALVNYVMLAKLANTLGLHDFVRMSRGESRDTGRAREVILANTMEAVIGAVYLDQGYDVARALIDAKLLVSTDEIIANRTYKDPKSELQEIIQATRKITPTYKVLSEDGPAHQRTFVLGVFFDRELIAEGAGPSKQEAEVAAARAALAQLATSDQPTQ